MGSNMASMIVRAAARTSRQTIGRRMGSSAAADASTMDAVMKADHSSAALKIMHKTNLVAMAMTPVVFMLPESMSMIITPFNVVLGVVLPIHAHIGFAGIVTDYAPKVSKGFAGPARIALVGVTGLTVIGLLKHNLAGDGMTKSIKSLWVKPESK